MKKHAVNWVTLIISVVIAVALVPVAVYFWKPLAWTLGSIVGLAAVATILYLLFVKRKSTKWKSWLIPIGTIAVLGLAAYGIKRLYGSSTEKEEARSVARFQAAAQAEQDRLNLARKLRSAIVIPDKDTTFVVVATDKGSPMFLPPDGYCTRRKPVNPSHSFVTVTQDGRFLNLPNSNHKIGNIQYFSVESYGAPTTEVVVEVSKLVDGECKPPKR